jgi:hypothetical protein
MPNPYPKRISVHTPPALTPEPNLDQNDFREGNEEVIAAPEIFSLHSTTEQTSRILDLELGLEADVQFNFENTVWTSTSPWPPPLTPTLSEFEGNIYNALSIES